MHPILTTITPYWKRPEMLACWIKNLRGVTIPEVQHFLFAIGEMPDPEILKEAPPNLFVIHVPDKPGTKSIGHYHNLGAAKADTEWIQKLDVDCFPNAVYFSELLELLKNTPLGKWYNGGMLYVNQDTSEKVLAKESMPLGSGVYDHIMRNRDRHSNFANALPAGSNFICRRWDYLELGGCSDEFQGYGWEDYQQLYMLECGGEGDPLPGPVSLQNVTQRCRDEISVPKAIDLWKKNKWLVLFHKWHPRSREPGYMKHVGSNRIVLYKYVQNVKSNLALFKKEMQKRKEA